MTLYLYIMYLVLHTKYLKNALLLEVGGRVLEPYPVLIPSGLACFVRRVISAVQLLCKHNLAA